MKKIIIIFALLCAILSSRAQYESFFGRESWEYATAFHPIMGTSDYDPELLSCLTNTYRFTRTDTVTIAGQTYYNSTIEGLGAHQVKLREDTLNGRLYSLIGNNEFLICDMSLEVGDTFTLPIPTWTEYLDTMRMMVDSVTFVNSKKVIHLSALTEEDEYWWFSFFAMEGAYNVTLRFMEGIGPMYGIVPPYHDGELLLCLTKDDTLYYMTHQDMGCWQSVTNVPDYEDVFLTIYPNPSEHLINLKFSAIESIQGSVFIRDILGRVCFHTNVTMPTEYLNISSLLPGVYMLTFIDQQNRKITKKIIKQ